VSPRLYLTWLVRDSRGARGRLAFFVVCLAVGVAAVVAVAALADNLDQGLRKEAKQLLGADIAITGRRPPPPAVVAAATALPGARTCLVRELDTMAAAANVAAGRLPPSTLVELKSVCAAYPFVGRLTSEPAAPLDRLLDADGAVAAPELFDRLRVRVGDRIHVGEATFVLRAVLRAEPDRAITPFTFGPRLLLGEGGFARTRLETFGSRIGYRQLVQLPGNATRQQVAAAAERLRSLLAESPWWRLQTWSEAQPELRQGLSRVERYLGLVALLSLLVGGIGVAQSVRAFLASRLDAVAVLKCLGVRPREAFALYLGQCLLLGLAGGVAGGLVGLVVQQNAPKLLGDLLPAQQIAFWQPWALLRGLSLGIAASLLFAMPPLVAVLRVPPLRALRRSAEALPASRLARAASGLLLVAGTYLLALAQAGDAGLALRFTGALIVAVAVLALAGWGLRAAAARLARLPRPLTLRHGAALLARPAGDALPALVAVGLGVLVVLVATLVERHLTASLDAELPKGSPSTFLVDVQPDQWPAVSALLAREGATAVDSVPVVMARIAEIDGVKVEKLAGDEDEEPAETTKKDAREGEGRPRERRERERRWALTREQRLTYRADLPPDNRLVAGRLWSNPKVREVSLEEEYARELGARLGSRLVFDVQGVPVELVVTSLRAVDWRTFRINFFVVVEPGVLEDAPQTRLAAARLPPGREGRVQDLLAQGFPNVTLVDVRQVLAKVAEVFRRLGLGVRFLGGFTAIAGVAILFGAVAAGAVRRGREVALLKTLGFTRRGVASLFAVEHALTGLVAGILGVAGGAVIARQVVVEQLELTWRPFAGVLGTALGLAVALTLVAGLGASARALRQRPIEALREERE
jgi:putative ABC transport system permease protein